MLKKSILSFCFIICFAAFLILMINSAAKITLNVSSESVITLPDIIIDAGHGGEDGGAVGVNNVNEKDINLSISRKCSDLLKFYGFNITETRTCDNDLSNGESSIRSRKVSDMKKRLEIYNSSDNNVVISIHQNKFEQSKYSGTQVFFSANNEKSEILAEKIKFTVKTLLQPDNEREIKCADSGIYLLNNASVPAVLVECGFISNDEECALLLTNEYQRQISFAIASGLLDFVNTSTD